MPIRETFKLIYKSLTVLITIGLGVGAVAAWWYSTPANQLMLISGILAILALMAGLSISKLDDQDRQSETYRSMFADMRALTRGTIQVHYAEPEVHRVSSATLEDVKRIAAEGAPIDELCRAVDPDHDRHDPAHQEAFRRIVRAMIEQG